MIMGARLRRLLVLLVVAPLLALVACHQEFGTAGHGGPAGAAGQTTLTNIRAGEHPGFDRLVFDFYGPVPAYFVEYVPKSELAGASGIPISIAGNYFLRVRFTDTVVSRGVPFAGTPPFDQIRQYKYVESFEAVTVYGIGVRERQPFRVFALNNPSRVVFDIRR